jgi:hypothetical protein
MQSSQTIDPQEVRGGQLTEDEARWLRGVQRLVRDVSNRDWFVGALGLIGLDIEGLQRHGYSMTVALASGFRSQVGEFAARLSDSSSVGESKDIEQRFLRDIDGLIDFAVRNGLAFDRVMAVLGHDVQELRRRYDSDLEKAIADQFHPKVTGWAKKNSTSVGEPDLLTE